MRRWALITAAVLLAGGLTACQDEPAVAPPTAPPPSLVGMMTFNICGGCERTLPAADWLQRMAAMIDLHQPDVVLLQEVCRGQYNLLNKLLSGRAEGQQAQPYSAAWRTTVDKYAECGHWKEEVGADAVDDFGLAVLVRGGKSIDHVSSWPLNAPATFEPRLLLCVDARPGGELPLRACTVKVERDAKVGADQVNEIARLANDWSRAGAVVVGGDFNVRSTAAVMKKMYSKPLGTGRFRELDDGNRQFFGTACPQADQRCRTGHGTLKENAEAKFDFLFVSEDYLVPVEIGVNPGSTDFSDHYALVGTAARAVPTASPQPSGS